MIIITGSVVIDPAHAEHAERLCVEHSVRSRSEPGCLHHVAHRDLERPDRIVFVEHWANRAAVEAHFALPTSAAFLVAIRELVTEPPTIELFEATLVQMT